MAKQGPFDGRCDRCGLPSDQLKRQLMLHTLGPLNKLRIYWRIFTGRSPWEWEHLCSDCRGREKDYAIVGLVLAVITVGAIIAATIWAVRLTP